MLRRAAAAALPARVTNPLLQRSPFTILVRAAASRTSTNAPGAKADKLLFTPGPLSTSYRVKAGALRDLGSRDSEFINAVKEVRKGVLNLANLDEKEYTMIPIQGSGTFGVEAVISSVVPKPDKGGLLLVANGAYGLRIAKMCQVHSIRHVVHEYPDDTAPDQKRIEEELKRDTSLTHVAVVHSETTSGIINDIHSIGQIVRKYNRSYIVDGMSSFGALDTDFQKAGIDFLITSANKCIQGVPGFAVVVARKKALAESEGRARTLSLNIHDQAKGLDRDGQFRFTPPTHAILAFREALNELKEEGGVEARRARYQKNYEIIDNGLRKLGFVPYLEPQHRGPIISTYRHPKDPKWSFEKFYNALNARDLVIYPGKVTNADSFRVGHIGHMFPEDAHRLVTAVAEVVKEMGFNPAAQ